MHTVYTLWRVRTWILGREIFRGRRLDTLSWQAAPGWVWTVVPAEWFILSALCHCSVSHPRHLSCDKEPQPFPWNPFTPQSSRILLGLPTGLSLWQCRQCRCHFVTMLGSRGGSTAGQGLKGCCQWTCSCLAFIMYSKSSYSVILPWTLPSGLNALSFSCIDKISNIPMSSS